MFARLITNQVVKVIDLNDETITYEINNEIGVRHTPTLKASAILKVADTIEKLCDCFVSVQVYKDEVTDFDVYYSHGRNDFRDWFSEEIAEDCDIYGAIHIEDKGLIYVAKLNEKGELELL